MNLWLKTIDNCNNNPENFSTTKLGEHILCRYSMSTLWAFNNVGNKHSLYRGEDCMKKFCISLRENAADAINFEKKKMFPLTEKELKSHQDSTACYICRKNSHTNLLKMKITEKLETTAI